MNKLVKNTSGIFLLAMLLLGSSCSHKKEQDKTQSPAIAVTLSEPALQTTGGISASGTVRAGRTAQISTRMMGYITKFHVKPGDRVRKGQLLVTISDQDLRAKKAQAEAAVNSAEAAQKVAEKDHERFTTLHKQESASAKELENINLNYDVARSNAEAARQGLKEVNALLAYTQITAPFPGMVSRKLADEGNMANPGMPLLTLEQDGTFKIVASIPESEISHARIGEQANITIKSIDRLFSGEIMEISRSSQFTGGQYLVKISVPGQNADGLYSGMYANVFIPLDAAPSASSVWVPEESLIRREQLAGLFTVNNQTACLRWVRTGKSRNGQVEIIAGLAKNEPFILRAESKLYNGAPVKIN
jgi:RND family efflux transporter MFP subunit